MNKSISKKEKLLLLIVLAYFIAPVASQAHSDEQQKISITLQSLRGEADKNQILLQGEVEKDVVLTRHHYKYMPLSDLYKNQQPAR